MALERVEKLKRNLAADGIENFIITKGTDVEYLTGFSGGDGVTVLVLTPAKDYFVTDGRYETQVKEEVPTFEAHIYKKWTKDPSNYYTCAGDIIAEAGIKEAALVTDDITFSAYQDLAGHAKGCELKPVKDYVAELRCIKDEGELALIKRACKISMKSFYALLDTIQPGVTEREVSNELEHLFHTHGGTSLAFDNIVASGPVNGACPHATVSDRVIEEGDFVTIDFGTRYNRYCSDITRTMVVGKAAKPEMYKIWETVQKAKDTGAAMIRPGVTFAEASNAINKVVEDAGYKIPHGVGHNLGLDIHEAPFMGARTDIEMKPGMVFTIEPGIYVPGVGGVRQEDDYLITEDGAERLTYITDHLIEL